MHFIIQFLNFALIYLIFLGSVTDGRISNKRKCVDNTCSQPISLATSLLQYVADDSRLLSFPPKANAKIFSKEAGDFPSLWEAEINGKRGYVPKGFFKETKLFVKNKDVNVIVSTGRDEGKYNATATEMAKNKSDPISTTTETPPLSTHSKGMFSMIGGASADSVPTSSPEIKPHKTEEFSVYDGTTFYVDPESLNDDKPPDITPEVLENPTESKPPLAKSSIDITKVKETSEGMSDNVNLNLGVTKEAKNVVDKIKQIPKLPSVSEGMVNGNEKPDTNVSSSPALENSLGVDEISGKNEEFNTSQVSAEEMDTNVQADKNSENVSQEINNKVEEDSTTVKKAHQTTTKPAVENQHSETQSEPGVFSNIFSHVSSYISSGDGAEEKEEEENDKDVEVSVSEGDNVSDKDKDILSLEENKDSDQLPTSELKETHSQPQHSEMPQSPSEEPGVSQMNEPSPKKLEETASSIPEASTDKVEASHSGVSDREDDKYLSDNKQQVPTDFQDREDTENISNDSSFTSSDDVVSHNQSEIPETEQPKLILSPLQTDLPDPHAPVSTENPSSPNVEQSPTTDSKTSKPVDVLLLAELNKSELYTDQEIKTEDLAKTSYFDEPDVSLINEVTTDAATETEASSSKDNVNIPKPFQGETLKEDVVKPVHEETLNEFVSESEKHVMQTDDTKQINDADINISEETKLEAESVFSQEQVDEPFNKPEVDEKPFSPSTPSPVYNTLPFHPSQYSPTYSPDNVPTSERSNEESKESIEEPIASDDESQVVSDMQSEENVDVSTDFPMELDPFQQESEGEAQVVETISTEASSQYTPEPKQEDSTEGLLSWFGPVSDFFSSFRSQPDEIAEVSSVSSEQSQVSEHSDPFQISSLKEESCLADGLGEEACEALKNANKEVPQDYSKFTSLYSTDISSTLELLERIPLEATLWLIITAVVVLIFSLGHYYIEAHRRDGPLVAIINKLEREVLILKKECSIQDDRLHTAQEQLEAWNTNSSENDALIVELKQELEELRATKGELEEQNAVLERELETVTENGLEMHRLLSESLSSQDGSQLLLSTVESLREKLDHQEDEINNLSLSLQQKDQELEEVREKLAKAQEVASGLEDKVVAVLREKEEEALELKEKHRQLIAQLEEVTETKALDETRMSMEMSKLRLSIEELQKNLIEKDLELEEVKEVVKELRSTDSNEKIDALFDVVGVRAQLKQAVTDRDTFREKFQEEEGARKLLEGHMKKITQEVAELKNSFETAEKEKIEALTKLQVLSNYFKEKESQLQKELGLQESMWLHKQSEDHSIYEQMKSLREENEKYKVENTTTIAPPQPKPRLAEVKTKKKSNPKIGSVRQAQGLQNESLKKEIVEQEASFKIQIANVEQKAHENWVTSRQAERRLKEVQQEAAQLRNRLTMEKSNFSLDDSKQNMNESNGDPSSPPPSLIYPPTASPPFMIYPHMPPPGDFIPPPPLTGSPYPSDSRPPPLGRISSPPLDHRFSPPPPLPYPPFDYSPYGHHSPSPPPPLPPQSHHRNVHKPQPREMSREQKDHSNYSPETDKPKRRNKR